MQGSLFDASPFNQVILEKDYVGVRNIWLESSTMIQSDALLQVPLHCDKWFWPRVTVEKEGNTLCSWIWSVWPRRGVGKHYAQFKTSLHNIEWGNATLKQYWRVIILDHTRLFMGTISPDFLFMDDNKRPHRNAEASSTVEKWRY